MTVDDPALARDVRRCQDLPGQTLFSYRTDDGETRAIGSADVNGYLAEVTGGQFTAKDFRTWWATVSAATLLREAPAPIDKAQTTHEIVRVIDVVAAELGNTRSVCRKCYVHPIILTAYGNGTLTRTGMTRHAPADGLTADEAWTISVIRHLSSKGQRHTRARRVA